MESIYLALIGGLIIGCASSLMLWSLGRISGISGIYGMILSKPKSENIWRYGFLLGLIFGGLVLYLFAKEQFFSHSVEGGEFKIILAGLFVGLGTRLGSGCTSGHGVCGISSFRKRSIIATLIFMLTGIITVSVERLLL